MPLSDLVVAVAVEIFPEGLDKLRGTFKTVHYHPDGDVPSEVASSVQLLLTTNKGLPPKFKSVQELPRLQHVQMISAGADKALASDRASAYAANPGVTLSTAAGIHVLSIPNYVVAMVINIFNQIPRQIELGRQEKRWADAQEVDQSGASVFFNRMTYGRTVGVLGYGTLGRETARLLKALGMKVIAANTSGKATPQEGYVFPGTGDADGSIPSQYYSTTDKKALEAFLSRCDVLVAILPSTKHTTYILDRHNLALLPKGAVLINVGRGTLIRSEELAAALDVPGHLLGAAVDLTDPEPLPDGHPLWSHPKLLITPHLSGDTEGELNIAVDIFLANAQRIAEGKPVYNKVDFARGY
ncbi:hypothetical protein EHS25_003621 [Saitozyma podzolica]|uniref:D-isomer specific 2-hydroxyacid dehydrogenase NAD-binding domain-containing protein n=1 Tax=Saitozyma podzolica TaxID=1890683 RepID=A0A427Y7R6_9TREE|nr:hypothetical protein EHS25_003621 [Saitozyma podzolica]